MARVRAHLVAITIAAAAASWLSCERIAFYSSKGASASSAKSAVSSGGGGAVTRAAVLEAIATCTNKQVALFRSDAADFDAAASLAAKDPSKRDAARAAWQKAIDRWQRLELFQFGPAGLTKKPGGQGLRDYVYSWPLVSRCLVEESIVAQGYAAPTFASTALINVRGLAAAEYLLFYDGTANACSPASPINTGPWAALTTTELAHRKAAYAAVVASDVAAKAKQLADAWDPAQGNFADQLAHAGQAGSIYASDRAALNAVSDALFYFDSVVKDAKLAKPLGIRDCEAGSCPEALESLYAHRAKRHLANNLAGFRMLFFGCTTDADLGFDDLLTAAGASAVASDLSKKYAAVVAALDAVTEDDLGKALADHPASVQAVHAAARDVTDILKVDFVTLLDLELPAEVEGDND
jgi:uncharacterized protein